MMYVRTEVRPSTIHGLGLFAIEFVPKGTLIWKFTPGFDQKFTAAQIACLPSRAREYLSTYAYLSRKSGLYVLPTDNGKYFNHADKPNALSFYSDDEEEVVTRAIQDIRPGEEITDDYASFE